MASKKIPEGELACSFLGYAVIGFFLIHTPPWAMAFAVAFAITAACARAWAMAILLARVEAWAALLPLALVAAWAGIMTMAETGAGIVAGAFAGVICWFVFWAVGRRVAFTLDGQGLGSLPVVVVFVINGAVTWFVFGAVAGRVAFAVAQSKFLVVALVVAWAWAWTWAWFLFEFYTGIVIGSLGWACLGVALGMQLEVIAGLMAWALASGWGFSWRCFWGYVSSGKGVTKVLQPIANLLIFGCYFLIRARFRALIESCNSLISICFF
ncbi:MAG: hypothetical protein U7123_26285 [Potamolinea sp.]